MTFTACVNCLCVYVCSGGCPSSAVIVPAHVTGEHHPLSPHYGQQVTRNTRGTVIVIVIQRLMTIIAMVRG